MSDKEKCLHMEIESLSRGDVHTIHRKHVVRLSYGALGLFTAMKQISEGGYDITMKELLAHGREGRCRIEGYMKELDFAGCIRRESIRVNGRLAGSRILISDYYRFEV